MSSLNIMTFHIHIKLSPKKFYYGIFTPWLEYFNKSPKYISLSMFHKTTGTSIVLMQYRCDGNTDDHW